MPRIVHLIAGFRRTGKDTLHSDLASGNLAYNKNKSLPWCDYTWIPLWMMFILRMITIGFHVFLELIKHLRERESNKFEPRWLVFSNRANAIRTHQEYLLVTRDRQHAAFARILKREVHERIKSCFNPKKLKLLTDEWFEQNKEQGIKIGETITTPRELYISVGEAAKRKDPIIWVRKCFDSFACKENNPAGVYSGSEIVDITDWRFPCEQIYAMLHAPIYRIYTTRIYRSAVDIPNNESERGLDHMATDLLLVSSWLDMVFALIRWPQYARHMHIGSLA